MHRPKRWNIAPPHPAADDLAARLKTSRRCSPRSCSTAASASPATARLSSAPASRPARPARASPTCARPPSASPRRSATSEKIVIYGDYDVDGITATAILWHAIRSSAASVDFYVPHRIDEGYGLNADAIGQTLRPGRKLIITVDCGITAIEQAKVACERGVDLIITDHHEWHEAEDAGRRAGARKPHASAPDLVLVRACFPTASPSSTRASRRRAGLSQPAPVRRRRRVQARLGHRPGDERGRSRRRASSAISSSKPPRWRRWAPSPTSSRWSARTASSPTSASAG